MRLHILADPYNPLIFKDSLKNDPEWGFYWTDRAFNLDTNDRNGV